MYLKTRGSEKVAYSKSSCLRLFFWNQLIKYSVSDITLNDDKYRRKNSHSITVRSCCRTHLTLLISGLCRSAHPSSISRCLLKNEPITLCLTKFYFHGTVSKKIFGGIWPWVITLGLSLKWVPNREKLWLQ